MEKQVTNEVLMIRPKKFYFNYETAVNNAYQKNLNEKEEEVEKRALLEFDNLVDKIEKAKIKVNIIQDIDTPYTPDSIFPNNWFSTHRDKKIMLYPMFAENRRDERKKFLNNLRAVMDKEEKIVDLTYFESENIFLEGTGALVLDRKNKRAFCSLSQRANKEVLKCFDKELGYNSVIFKSYQTFDNRKVPIYHTNVMMGICEKFAVVCFEAIDDLEERKKVSEALSSREIIEISLEQVLKFCGNILELESIDGKRYTLMSKTAFEGFEKKQKEVIEKYTEIIYSDISTIETYGGGSVRCMLAEIFR